MKSLEMLKRKTNKKKSNDYYKITTSYDLADIVTLIGFVTICLIGIGFTIFSIIMVLIVLL